MFVHCLSHEARTRRHVTPWGDVIETKWHRFVCSCGAATSWWRRYVNAQDDAARHVCDGQLSVSV